jgi:hypothetical protein
MSNHVDIKLPIDLNEEFKEKGTRFKVFTTPANVGGKVETIYVSTSPDQIRKTDGFGDGKFRVVEKKSIDYGGFIGEPTRLIPRSIKSGSDGHFDYLNSVGQQQEFFCAALYASARRTLDMWEKYAGHEIRWISDCYAGHLELLPYLNGFGAYSNYSNIQFGYWSEGTHYCGSSYHMVPKPSGPEEFDLNLPNCENFEVIAHEVGHNILSAEMGLPSWETYTPEFKGFHESLCDVIAILASLQFDSVVESLLEDTKGNLYGYNEASSIMPMPNTSWVRTAFNEYRISSVYRLEAFSGTLLISVKKLVNQIQQQGSPQNAVQQAIYRLNTDEMQQAVGVIGYELSRVLTGTIFDIFVEIFQKKLQDSNAISTDLNKESFHNENYALISPKKLDEIQGKFSDAYQKETEKFKTALLEARDEMGLLLTRAVSQLSPHQLLFFHVANALLKADKEIFQGKYQDIMRDCFKWRGIKQPYPPLVMV